MEKLFKLKQWLTLSEAANHLSIQFGEDVAIADVLRFGLDNKLKLSVIFLGQVNASSCKPIDLKNEEYVLSKNGQITYRSNGEMLQVQNEVFELENDWPYELTMMGGESATIQAMYWHYLTDKTIEPIACYGTFVADSKNVFQLKSEVQMEVGGTISFMPMENLPENVAIVVLPSAINDFEKTVGVKSKNGLKPLSTLERESLLKLVVGMAIDGYGYEPTATRSPIPKQLADSLAVHGIDITDDTIRKYLKLATDTVLPAKPR